MSCRTYALLRAGVSKVINRGDSNTMFKIVPETTQDFANRITCFNIPGSSDAPITAQSLLPNASFYTVMIKMKIFCHVSCHALDTFLLFTSSMWKT